MTSTSTTQPPLPVGSQGQAISVISNKYRLARRLGGGSFGDIYLGEYIPTTEKVAIKFEKHGARCPQLRHEYKVYRELQHCAGFGKVHYFGQHDCYNVMVMELLGYSLEDLFNKCGRRFSLRTVLQLADQVLERVETMHNRHLIHRDIKPANFVVGHGPTATTVHCIDFGLSKRYRHPRTLQHIAYRDGRSLTGTPRYASINNHLGIEQSRRDDLESIGYVLVYFLRGVLPWQGLKAKTASKKYKMIMEKKQSVSISELCQGCPVQFAEYLTYCRSLSFDGKPDMQYLRGLFRDLYIHQGYGLPLLPPTVSSSSASAASAAATGASTTTGSAAVLAASAGPIQWDWDRFVNPSSYASTSTSGGGGVQATADKARAVAATTKARAVAPAPARGGVVDVMDVTGADDHKPPPAVVGAGEGGGGVVMMQTTDMEGVLFPTSPLNKLKQSLRITDDGDGAPGAGNTSLNHTKSHKRHLSLSDGGGGGVGDGGKPSGAGLGLGVGAGAGGKGGVVWSTDGYKQQVGGSRAKTGHHSTTQQQAVAASSSRPTPSSSSSSSIPACCRRCGGKNEAECGCGVGMSTAAAAAYADSLRLQNHTAPLASSSSMGSAGGGAGGNKQDSFLNGFLRKAKSFARPTSSTNLTSTGGVSAGGGGGGGVGGISGLAPAPSARRPSLSSSGSGGGGKVSAVASARYTTTTSSSGKATGSSSARIPTSSSSSSKHLSAGGFGSPGLAVPS